LVEAQEAEDTVESLAAYRAEEDKAEVAAAAAAEADFEDEDGDGDAFEDDEPSNPFASVVAEVTDDPERRTLGDEIEPGSEIAHPLDGPRRR
jgi:hypothetical protein